MSDTTGNPLLYNNGTQYSMTWTRGNKLASDDIYRSVLLLESDILYDGKLRLVIRFPCNTVSAYGALLQIRETGS